VPGKRRVRCRNALPLAGKRFQARAADLVKVGGKRSSLGALSAELNRIPGVVYGVFWLPAAGQARVAAFAVAPGLDKRAILEQWMPGFSDPL